MNAITHLNYVSIHPGKAEHDAQCPKNPTQPDGVTWGQPVTPTRHFRVSRPFVYRSPKCPGHRDVSARQGHYTDACCATQAARIITARLLAAKAFTNGATAETLDVQVWR